MEEIQDVAGDGNCGFRAIALALGRDTEEWCAIRQELYSEILSNGAFYESLAEQGAMMGTVNEVLDRVLCKKSPAPHKNWLALPTCGDCIANCYERPVFFYSATGWSYTFFPSLNAPNYKSPPICLAYIDYPSHFVCLKMKEGIFPVPNPAPWWARNRDSCARGWKPFFRDHLALGKDSGIPSFNKK